MSFTITSGNLTFKNLSIQERALKEAALRGLKKNYTIIYPDGDKIHCEIQKS